MKIAFMVLIAVLIGKSAAACPKLEGRFTDCRYNYHYYGFGEPFVQTGTGRLSIEQTSIKDGDAISVYFTDQKNISINEDIITDGVYRSARPGDSRAYTCSPFAVDGAFKFTRNGQSEGSGWMKLKKIDDGIVLTYTIDVPGWGHDIEITCRP